jgi:hypothetical protein
LRSDATAIVDVQLFGTVQAISLFLFPKNAPKTPQKRPRFQRALAVS